MIDYRLKRCCQICPHIEVKVKRSENLCEDLFYSEKVIPPDIEIYCVHEKVCKSLNKSKKELL